MNRSQRREAEREHKRRMRTAKQQLRSEGGPPDARDSDELWVRDWVNARLAEPPAHESETFERIVLGVLSTTGRDRQGDAMTAEALFAMCEQINSEHVPINVEHDDEQPPVGRIIGARVRHNERAGMYELLGLIGYYDRTCYPTFEQLEIVPSSGDSGIDPTLLDDHRLELGANQHTPAAKLAHALTSSTPLVFEEDVRVQLEKSDEANMALWVYGLTTAWLAAVGANLSAESAKSVGAEVRFQAVDAFQYLCERWDKIRGKKRIVHEWRTGLCVVRFIAPTPLERHLRAAMERLGDAVATSRTLAVAHPDFRNQTWVYRVASNRWELRHAYSIVHGYIVDKPLLVKLEHYPGVSIGATTYSRHILPSSTPLPGPRNGT